MKKLIKDYENWFLKLRDSKKHWPKSCEDIYYDSIENIRKLLKKTEKDFYLDIDKEISKKKYDRATLTKAKRMAKNKEIDSYYIDLRFDEMMEEYTEEKIEPLLAITMKKIITIQADYERKKKFKPIGGDSLFD
tara:strand:- start:293 stop:694 length:402 start_codon:yes stop_codon:yes gene_type:complete